MKAIDKLIQTKAMNLLREALITHIDHQINPLESFKKDMVTQFKDSPAAFLDNCDRAFEYMAQLTVLYQVRNALKGKDSQATFESVHEYVQETVLRMSENSGTSSSTTGTFFKRCQLQAWSRLHRDMNLMWKQAK